MTRICKDHSGSKVMLEFGRVKQGSQLKGPGSPLGKGWCWLGLKRWTWESAVDEFKIYSRRSTVRTWGFGGRER